MKKTAMLCTVLLGCILLSCCVGKYEISLAELVRIVQGQPSTAMHALVLWQIRLPRTVMVACAGGALALSGFVYQTLFRNALVSPDVLGVSSGASVGAIAAILCGVSTVWMQAWAFAGGVLVVLCTVLLAHWMGGKRLLTTLLAGMILGAFCNAIIMTLKYTADPQSHLATIEYWLMGSFHTITWAEVGATVPIMAVSAVVLWLLRRPLQVLALGEEEAQSLGIAVRAITTAAIVCATLLVSAVVSVAGVVAWVGLIVPHMVRFFAGENYLQNFTQSALVGGILLLIADMLIRGVFTAEVPIGILTALMGGIFLCVFLYLRNRKEVVSDADS